MQGFATKTSVVMPAVSFFVALRNRCKRNIDDAPNGFINMRREEDSMNSECTDKRMRQFLLLLIIGIAVITMAMIISATSDDVYAMPESDPLSINGEKLTAETSWQTTYDIDMECWVTKADIVFSSPCVTIDSEHGCGYCYNENDPMGEEFKYDVLSSSDGKIQISWDEKS